MNESIYLSLKRPLDILVSLSAIVFLSPILLVLAVSVAIVQGRPVLFTQERGGYRGSVFRLYKFRSMTDQRDQAGNLLPDHMRLNRFGCFLRDYSLDELPGLLNVLKGDMSIVGPRPFISEYLPLYNERQARRHDVRPGLTGWAQVNGRNGLDWHEKFELDLWYVENTSFLTDIKILFMTVIKLLKRDGIASAGEVTGSRFIGNTE